MHIEQQLHTHSRTTINHSVKPHPHTPSVDNSIIRDKQHHLDLKQNTNSLKNTDTSSSQSQSTQAFQKHLGSIIDRVDQIISQTNRSLNEDVCKQELCAFYPNKENISAMNQQLSRYSSELSFSEKPSRVVSKCSPIGFEDKTCHKLQEEPNIDLEENHTKLSTISVFPLAEVHPSAMNVVKIDNTFILPHTSVLDTQALTTLPDSSSFLILKPAIRDSSIKLTSKFSGEVVHRNPAHDQGQSKQLPSANSVRIKPVTRPQMEHEFVQKTVKIVPLNIAAASKNQAHTSTDNVSESAQCPGSKESRVDSYTAEVVTQQPKSILVKSTMSRIYASSWSQVQSPSQEPTQHDLIVEDSHNAHSTFQPQNCHKEDVISLQPVSLPFSLYPPPSCIGQADNQAIAGSLGELKIEEICTKLNFLVKRPFNCVKVLLSLLYQVILSDSVIVDGLCARGSDTTVALSKLQTACQRAEGVTKEIGNDDTCSLQITVALVASLKSVCQELLNTIRPLEVTSRDHKLADYSANRHESNSVEHQSQHSLDTKTFTDAKQKCDEKFNNAPQMKEAFDSAKQQTSTNINTKLEPIDSYSSDITNLDHLAELVCEQSLSFRVCCMARWRKQILLGFEDGAISFVSLTPTLKVNLDKAIRYNTQPVTSLLCLELTDKKYGEILVAACGMKEAVLVVWEMRTLRVLAEMKGHSQFVSSLQRVGETHLASSSFDKSIRVWDCQTWQCVNSLYLHDAPIITCAYSSQLNLLASGDLMGQIVLTSPIIEEGRFRSCHTYTKFKGCGPILELCFDPHRRLVSFENSKMRVYDCRGTLFREIQNFFYVSSVHFLDPVSVFLVDISGIPHWLDYEQSLNGTAPPRSLPQSNELEMASQTISHRVTGRFAKAQTMKIADSLMVFSLDADSRTLRVHFLN